MMALLLILFLLVLCLLSTVADSFVVVGGMMNHHDGRTAAFICLTTPAAGANKANIVRKTTGLYHNSGNYEGDEDDDDEPPDVDVASWRPPTTSYGWNKGRSSPATRKAFSKSGMASVHICSNCGSEFVKWMGRCPTCKEWNTLQEHAVAREPSSSAFTSTSGRPVFGGSGSRRPGSWLDDLSANRSSGAGNVGNEPIRITDLTRETGANSVESRRRRLRRIRIPGDDELNTVLGGGIMQGSLILLGGDPGVGKSTLLLQVAASVARSSTAAVNVGMGALPAGTSPEPMGPVWYVSGEENPGQIASRAARLGIDEPELFLLRETDVDTLCQQIVTQSMPSRQLHHEEYVANAVQQPRPLSLVVIDSIQTMVCEAGGASAAGGVTQVRECVAMFLRLAKSTGIPVMLIGHVTKSGDVAGPRTVEHMVDCVLYLEGGADDSGATNLRMIRASKNRFGSADEVGIYEMTRGSLLPVSDPSSLFLAHRKNDKEDLEGCAVAIKLEGMRTIAVEVQALVVWAAGDGKSNYGGRRTVNGVAFSRLLLLMGVLQKHCGMFWSRRDVYVNVVGRMRLDLGEGNAGDLAIAIALASSLNSVAVRSDTAFVGEVGLLGELRSVPAVEKRLDEARRMGFSRVVTPPDLRRKGEAKHFPQQKTIITRLSGLEWVQCETLQSAINEGLVAPIPKRRRPSRSSEPGKIIDVPGAMEDLYLEEITDDQDYDDDT